MDEDPGHFDLGERRVIEGSESPVLTSPCQSFSQSLVSPELGHQREISYVFELGVIH